MNEFYMHVQSGDVQTKEEWRSDYESMKYQVEEWGYECFEDAFSDCLIEVVRDEDGDWVEA